jgi:nitrate reductase assembly molybdenum cofactor insertion protein NarJ
MKDRKHYSLLAQLFKYPEGDFMLQMKESQDFLNIFYPQAGKELQPFSDYINNCSPDERMELFTKTFDVQPICYLDLGYVMFGEDYKRGAFLLNMKVEQQKINNDCGTDLPDNICNVLVLMTKSNDDEFVEDLVWRIFIPCLKKMLAEFDSARVDMKMKILRKKHRAIIQEELNHGNVYKNCFTALLEVLRKDFGEIAMTAEDSSVLSSSHHRSFFNKQTALQTFNHKQNSEAQDYASSIKLD